MQADAIKKGVNCLTPSHECSPNITKLLYALPRYRIALLDALLENVFQERIAHLLFTITMNARVL